MISLIKMDYRVAEQFTARLGTRNPGQGLLTGNFMDNLNCASFVLDASGLKQSSVALLPQGFGFTET
jgi:hypothetical protein